MSSGKRARVPRAAPLLLAAALLGCGVFPRREPRDLESMLARARTEHLWNSDRQAVLYADRAAALESAPAAGRARAYRLSGEYRLGVGDAAGAREKLERALALAPEDPGALSLLAQAAREEPGAALGWAERALKASAGAAPGRRAALHLLAADIRVDLEDEEGAARELASALELDPGNLDALRAMARVERRRGGDAAFYARAAERAAEDAPEWLRPAARRYAARVWLDLDDEPRAARAYRRALELDPDDQEALRCLVEITGKEPGAAAERVAPPGTPPRPPEESWAEWTPQALERAERRDPDGVEAVRLRAARARERREPREAAREAGQLAEALWRAPLWQQAAGEVMAARLQLDLGDEREASVRLATALRLEPHSLRAWRLESRLKTARESRRVSVSVLHSSVVADQAPDAGQALAFGYREVAAARWTLGDPAGAERAVARALEAVPGDAAALELRARIAAGAPAPAAKAAPPADELTALESAVRSGRLSGEASLAALLKAWPDGASPRERWLSLRAEVVERLGGADAPVEDLRRLSDQVPGDVRALSLLVRAEARRSRTKEALSDADRLVAAAETSAPAERGAALRQRARLRLDAGDGRGAESDLRSALALDASDLEALELLVRAESDRPKSALAEVESRWPSSPRPPERWSALRGLARLRASGWEAARGDLEAAFAADPESVCRAETAQPGRDGFDAAYFDLCLRRYPRDSSLYNDRGVARYRAGRRAEALADFRRALELDPGNRAARLSLEAVLADAKRPAAAPLRR